MTRIRGGIVWRDLDGNTKLGLGAILTLIGVLGLFTTVAHVAVRIVGGPECASQPVWNPGWFGHG